MKTLSESVIATLAGEAAYRRGLEYYNDGRVEQLSINDTQISANVEGQQRYQVSLNHTAKMFDGSCDCPASDNFDFCKHCVAVSLAYYYQTQTNLEMADAGKADTLPLYLNTFTKPQLIEELNTLIQRNQSLCDHWLLRAEIASGNLSSKDLRKRITQAIPFKPSGLWRPQEVANYFSEAQLALKVLEPAVLALDARKAIKLIIYSIERVEKALDTIEDRAAYQSDLQNQLKDWFHQILAAPEWQGNERVALLSKLILDEKFSYQILNLPNGVLTLISNKESEDLMEAVSKEWTKMPPPNKGLASQQSLYTKLENILLEDAQLLNNKTRELEILAKGAVDTDRCLKLVAKCIDYQRLDEATKWLDYASLVETLRSHQVVAIETYQIELWLAQGEFDKALAAQW
ncbi:MAG: SWIM zinc finger family protein, partial [Arenicella sp.]|nr:SWIM zinc finger family protein [Arenicella sp.]